LLLEKPMTKKYQHQNKKLFLFKHLLHIESYHDRTKKIWWIL